MELVVRELSASEENRWDHFVHSHPLGSPFHLTAWKNTIAEVFGYQPLYRMVLSGDEIRGVLPLFLVKNLLMGKVLLSSPFAVYGGILAADPPAHQALAEHARQLGEQLGVQHVELRNAYPEQCSGFSRVSRYVTFVQRIDRTDEQLLEAIPRKTRRMVRKALEHPYQFRSTNSLGAFVELYSRNLHRLGTPCFPTRYFQVLQENFREQLEIHEVVLSGQVVAVVLSFYFRDRILPYYGASDPRYWDYAPNNYMYFQLMRWARDRGCTIFDFGRSKVGTGAHDFKAHWGMERRELPYEVVLVRRKHLPDYTPLNPRFQPAIRLWQRLPFWLTRALGPRLVRLVP